MRRNKMHKERIKTLLIVLFSISAVVLGLRTGLFDEPLRAGGFGDALPRVTTGQAAPATFPTTMMINLGFASHHGQRMDGEDTGVSALYDLFAGTLGEALGSSSISEPVPIEAWKSALTGQGVFFQYDVEVPGAVLAGWLGTDVGSAGGLMWRMALSVRQGVVYLYYMGRDGIPHRSATAVDAGVLGENIEGVEPNGAQYGFQTPAFLGADPFTVLLPSYDGFPVIIEFSAAGAVFGELDVVLERFGMHLSRARYLDEGGVRTMVEDGATLRFSGTGLIHYHCQADTPRVVAWDAGEPSLTDAIETAREIAQVLEQFSDEATVRLSNWYYASGYADGSVVFHFSYYFDGIPIWTNDPAATVIVRGRYVREVTLFARAFRRTGRVSVVMPELQAAAAAGDGQLVLSYAGTEEDTLRVRWIVRPWEGEVTADG